MEPSMENYLAQVLQKDLGRRLQVGQEIIDYIMDKDKSHDLEQDQTALDRMVDGIANSWVNSSNFKVSGAAGERWESGQRSPFVRLCVFLLFFIIPNQLADMINPLSIGACLRELVHVLTPSGLGLRNASCDTFKRRFRSCERADGFSAAGLLSVI